MFSDPLKNTFEFGFIPGETVVDFGSGAGHYSYALSNTVGPSGKVIAVDIQKEMLVRLKNEAEKDGRTNIETVWGDVEKQNGTHLRDGVAAGAVLSNILSMVEDREGTIREAKRVVRPGGKVCVVEWIDKISKDKMKELFDTAGLSFERVFEAGSHHYGMIFKKSIA
jgi:ubiquinone/menaquinone biosynthesis C-methylase UbiE